jgi:hypothetical protein
MEVTVALAVLVTVTMAIKSNAIVCTYIPYMVYAGVKLS